VLSFRELSEMLREELNAYGASHDLLRKAAQDLLQKCRLKALVLWGRRNAPNGTPNPAAEFEQIPLKILLDDNVAIANWDTLEANPEDQAALLQYRGPTFRDVRCCTEAVIRLWPAHTHTIADERKLVDWLTGLMRSNPDAPMTKAAARRLASNKQFNFSKRGFERAWVAAVKDSKAMRWSQPGRKS
jgi:hypothetical protein